MRKARIWRAFLIQRRIFSETRTAWLGREDSNLRMGESKSPALPLGDAPIAPNGFAAGSNPAAARRSLSKKVRRISGWKP